VFLFNLPSYASRTALEESPIQNSIFVFRTGGLCIVHLGNLRHPLTPRQLQRIGKPDILMIPADGTWTMPYDDVLTVIRQLQPLLVIPMHIEVARHAEVFVQAVAGRYRVRRLSERVLPLHRAALPAATEIVVFSHASEP
jgi:L-ascorbate metabolism protein UlaG (beta-lactamase superfamily)